jgi:hypothetical protein
MVLLSSSINIREERSAAFMPLIRGKDVADVDVDTLGTAVDAEVAEAEVEAEEIITRIL